MADRIRLREDVAQDWADANPVLASGEAGFDRTNKILKIGDGTTPWNDLVRFHVGFQQITYTANRTLIKKDQGKRLRFTSGATLTLDNDVFDVGDRFEVYAEGGNVTILDGEDEVVVVAGGVVLVVKDEDDVWLVTDYGGEKFTLPDYLSESTLSGTYLMIESAEKYGAIGDGVADDTTAVQAAITASGAGRPCVLTGDYRVTTALTVVGGEHLHLQAGSSLVKDFAAAHSEDALIRNDDFGVAGTPVKANGVRIDGPGLITTADTDATGKIILLYGDDITMADFTIDGYQGGQALLVGGDRMRLLNFTVTGSEVAGGTGGVRFIGGYNLRAIGLHIESGDDALQFVPIESPTAALFDLDIVDCWYIGCTGGSTAARFLIALHGVSGGEVVMSCSIRDSGFAQCDGYGTTRAAEVRNEQSTGTIQNVRTIGCTIDMTDGDGTQSSELLIKRATGAGPVRDISLDITLRNPQTWLFHVLGACERVQIDGHFPEEPAIAGSGGSSPQTTIGTVEAEVDGFRLSGLVVGGGTTRAIYCQADNTVILADFLEIPDGAFAVSFANLVRARVEGSRFVQAGTTGRAVQVLSTADEVELHRIDVDGLTSPFVLQSDTIVTSCRGFITRAKGTATLLGGGTTVDVTHGLARTPSGSDIQVTPVSGSGWERFWISAVGSSTFRINIAPVLVSDTQFVWTADVGGF